ncbi:MAG TPA: hypothetical protein VK524_24790 [Polyangiaceae bacterium]|nr:hypothetical protein [Polyangiaceae bacterium]
MASRSRERSSCLMALAAAFAVAGCANTSMPVSKYDPANASITTPAVEKPPATLDPGFDPDPGAETRGAADPHAAHPGHAGHRPHAGHGADAGLAAEAGAAKSDRHGNH